MKPMVPNTYRCKATSLFEAFTSLSLREISKLEQANGFMLSILQRQMVQDPCLTVCYGSSLSLCVVWGTFKDIWRCTSQLEQPIWLLACPSPQYKPCDQGLSMYGDSKVRIHCSKEWKSLVNSKESVYHRRACFVLITLTAHHYAALWDDIYQNANSCIAFYTWYLNDKFLSSEIKRYEPWSRMLAVVPGWIPQSPIISRVAQDTTRDFVRGKPTLQKTMSILKHSMLS